MQLEDRQGTLGLNSDVGSWQQWSITQQVNGKFLITSHFGNQLEDNQGALGLSQAAGDWQQWTIDENGVGKYLVTSYFGRQLSVKNHNEIQLSTTTQYGKERWAVEAASDGKEACRTSKRSSAH